MADAHKNLAISTVATAPSPAASGTSLVVAAGHGTRFPAVPFNATICPAGTTPDPINAEIVRVTNISTDTFTIQRAQESTNARTVLVGDLIFASVTAKSFTDIETVLEDHSARHESGGADAIKLDDFAAPDDNTDLDASASAHGLMPKADKVKLDGLISGSKTIASFSALSLFPGTSNYATFDTRGIMPVYEFDDGSDAGTSDETMYAVLRAKEGSDWSAGVKVYLEWMADTATTGNVMWEVAFARLNANNQDLDSLTFDTATLSSASAANGTSGKLTKPEITVAAADTDGIAAGDLFCLRITRKESNGSDTMTGDAQLVGGEIRSAA